MIRAAFLSALAVIGFTHIAMADDNTIALPPAGHTIINLAVTEHKKLTQDTLSAQLQIQQEGPAPVAIQDQINKAMANALVLAKTYPTVKATTGGYYVYAFDETPVTDVQTGKPVNTVKKWRGNQSIQLESTDATKLLELTGKIQSMGFTASGLDYSLSQEKSDSVLDELMTKALKAIGEKAKLAASALGKGSYDIIDVSVDGASPQPQPIYAKAAMMRSEAAIADVAAPQAQAGETDVTMTINARVMLKP